MEPTFLAWNKLSNARKELAQQAKDEHTDKNMRFQLDYAQKQVWKANSTEPIMTRKKTTIVSNFDFKLDRIQRNC